jgi:hypothetical protein
LLKPSRYMDAGVPAGDAAFAKPLTDFKSGVAARPLSKRTNFRRCMIETSLIRAPVPKAATATVRAA